MSQDGHPTRIRVVTPPLLQRLETGKTLVKPLERDKFKNLP